MQLDVQRRLHEQLEVDDHTIILTCRENRDDLEQKEADNFKFLIMQIQRNLQLRIEEQNKQLQMMFEQQQMTTQNLAETRNTNNKCTNAKSLSTTVEDPEILVIDGSDDDMVFPSKIS